MINFTIWMIIYKFFNWLHDNASTFFMSVVTVLVGNLTLELRMR